MDRDSTPPTIGASRTRTRQKRTLPRNQPRRAKNPPPRRKPRKLLRLLRPRHLRRDQRKNRAGNAVAGIVDAGFRKRVYSPAVIIRLRRYGVTSRSRLQLAAQILSR